MCNLDLARAIQIQCLQTEAFLLSISFNSAELKIINKSVLFSRTNDRGGGGNLSWPLPFTSRDSRSPPIGPCWPCNRAPARDLNFHEEGLSLPVPLLAIQSDSSSSQSSYYSPPSKESFQSHPQWNPHRSPRVNDSFYAVAEDRTVEPFDAGIAEPGPSAEEPLIRIFRPQCARRLIRETLSSLWLNADGAYLQLRPAFYRQEQPSLISDTSSQNTVTAEPSVSTKRTHFFASIIYYATWWSDHSPSRRGLFHSHPELTS
jgi:hypothetical protein